MPTPGPPTWHLGVNADIAGYASLIEKAHQDRWLLDPITDHTRLGLDDAYAVQRVLLHRRLARGERQVGWKIGYTSAAMRAQMGVDAPNYGPLTDAMVLADGDVVGDHLVHPQVEPEVLVALARPVPPGAGRTEVAGCVEWAAAALEVVDSVWKGYRFRLEDNTADGSSTAHVVVGDQLPASADLSALTVDLLVDGEVVEIGSTSAALGHPFDAISWLAAELGRRDGALNAGDLVLTGGLTGAHPLEPGSTVAGRFAGRDVSISRRAEAQDHHDAAVPPGPADLGAGGG